MKKNIFILLSFPLILFLVFISVAHASTEDPNPLVKFLNDIEYSSRLKVEYDDNIFLKESDEEGDFRQVFTQSLTYKLPKDNYYFQWGYTGNYSYYNQEATGVLGHSANVLYSYRPFDKISIGIRDDFNWLQDSKITTTLSDRVLALGYVQNTPTLQVKYEVMPKMTVATEAYYQFLDVRSGSNDDYIDNKQTGVEGRINYDITPQILGFVGFEYDQIDFSQIDEKSAVSKRTFLGVTKKYKGIANITGEIGFVNTDMDHDKNVDDDNIDYKLDIETVFSIYTKLRMAFQYDIKRPSLRREYTQYNSRGALLSLNHVINPTTSVYFDYSYEKQHFNSSDKLIGQPDIDRKATVQNGSITLSQKLKSWLTFDLKYNRTHRESDFDLESYADNQYSMSLTAKY